MYDSLAGSLTIPNLGFWAAQRGLRQLGCAVSKALRLGLHLVINRNDTGTEGITSFSRLSLSQSI